MSYQVEVSIYTSKNIQERYVLKKSEFALFTRYHNINLHQLIH